MHNNLSYLFPYLVVASKTVFTSNQFFSIFNLLYNASILN